MPNYRIQGRRLRKALKVFTTGLCIALSVLFCNASLAAELTTSAGINLLYGITVTEDREIDFGTLSGAQAGNCAISFGGALSGNVAGCTGTGTTGSFTIEGLRFFQVNVSLLPGTADGITFTPSFGNTTTLSGFLPAVNFLYGEANLEVVGELSWPATLTPGTKVIPYTLIANYD